MATMIGMYAVVGGIAGMLAGLLGIGGGLVIVPMLLYCFERQGISEPEIMLLALGTSMASIVFTAISSFWAHHRRGAVRWQVVKRIVTGILLGTFLGTTVASGLSTHILKGFFVVFLYGVSAQMMSGRKPKPGRPLPGSAGMFAVGNLIGVVSSLVGIGGGTMSVPFMVWCNISLQEAIGTSAAIGFPIALGGTAGYVFNGLSATNLPAYSLGYVYLPAFASIIGVSMLTAPLGVRLAHSLPVERLKQIFAGFLGVIATRMLIGLF